MHWRSFLLFFSILLFFSADTIALIPPGSPDADPANSYPGYIDEIAQYRVARLDIPFKVNFNSTVEGYIRGYVERDREKAEIILGRSLLYFSEFERLLKENGLPEELKYLAVVESALDPNAVSWAGAVGLWQFIPETGKYYGLDMDHFRDERRDPGKSTLAAIQYLQRLYERYGDWALAIAAYNSGPGRVSRAIRLARSTDFWRIRRYLPRETRSYVPAFIGAAYLMEHYRDHKLVPRMPMLDLQLTETISIYESISFYTIARVTGLALDVIRELNPGFIKEFIPAQRKGTELRLPKRVMASLVDYLKLKNLDPEHERLLNAQAVLVNTPGFVRESDLYFESVYTVGKNDNLYDLAAFFNCPVECLMAWNGLKSEKLRAGMELRLFQPRELRRFASAPEVKTIGKMNFPSLRPVVMKGEEFAGQGIKIDAEPYFWYTLGRQESLYDVSRRFPGNSLNSLMKLNQLDFDSMPAKGDQIKVSGFKKG